MQENYLVDVVDGNFFIERRQSEEKKSKQLIVDSAVIESYIDVLTPDIIKEIIESVTLSSFNKLSVNLSYSENAENRIKELYKKHLESD